MGIILERRVIRGKTYTTVTGKGYRVRRTRIGALRLVTAAFAWLYVAVAIVLPYATLIVMAFANNTAQLQPFTTKHFAYVLNDLPFFQTAVKNSIILATVGATVGMVFSSLISIIIVRLKVTASGVLSFLTTIPIAIPGLVMGAGVLWTYLWLGKSTGILLYGTLWVLMIACVTRFIPYGVRSTSSTLVQIHPELEESSRVCGRGGFQTLIRVTAPLLRPGIVAGWVLLFVIFFRELTMVILLYTGRSIVLPVLLIELWAEGTYSQVAALSLIQAAILFVFILLFRYLFKARVDLASGAQ
jgi:iron(III) transport system permease protein